MCNKLRSVMRLFISSVFSLFIIFTIIHALIVNISSNRLPQVIQRHLPAYIFAVLTVCTIIVFLSWRYGHNLSFTKNRPAILVLLLVLTAVPRLLWIYSFDVLPKSDFNMYHTLAGELFNRTQTGSTYIALFPHIMGYPTILAVFYKIFGARVIVAQLLNVVFCIGISITLYFIGTKLHNDLCGFLAAAFWALWPSQIFYTSLVCTESAYTLLTLVCIILFLNIVEGKKRSLFSRLALFLLVGVCCAAANAVRPFGLIILTAMAIYYFIFVREYDSTGFRFKGFVKPLSYGVLLLSYFFVFQLVSFFISEAVGQQVATSPTGFNAYVGSSIKSGGTWNKEDAEVLGKLADSGIYTPQQMHNILLGRAFERFKSLGHQTIDLLSAKHERLWESDGDSLWFITSGLNTASQSGIQFMSLHIPLSAAANFYYYMMILLCALCGLMILRRSHSGHILLILLLVIGIASAHMIMEVSERYHYPAIPLFALAAGYVLSGIGRTQFKMDSSSS